MGLALFVLGLLLAAVIGFRDARETGTGFGRSIGRGFVEMWRWMWDVMP